LEGLEDDLLLVGRDADARVGDDKGDHRGRVIQHVVFARPTRGDRLDQQIDATVMREFERIAEQVFDDLLQPLRIGENRFRQLRIELDVELDFLRLRDMAEGPLDVAVEIGEPQLAHVDHDRARLDLREVENVVNQHQQVIAGRVNRFGKLHLPGREIPIRVFT
jgi:hypothetical protein